MPLTILRHLTAILTLSSSWRRHQRRRKGRNVLEQSDLQDEACDNKIAGSLGFELPGHRY